MTKHIITACASFILLISCMHIPDTEESVYFSEPYKTGKSPDHDHSEDRGVESREEITGPLKISADQAILLALKNNPEILIKKLDIDIRKSYEQQERGSFYPVFNADVSSKHTEGIDMTGADTDSDIQSAGISLANTFTSGTTGFFYKGINKNSIDFCDLIFFIILSD